MKNLLIIGAGGHARPVIEIALLNDYTIVGVVDLNFRGQDESILGIDVIDGKDLISNFPPDEIALCFAIGDNNERKEKMTEFVHIGYTAYPTLIHPRAIVSDSSEIEDGAVICAGAIINPMVKVGKGVIINTGAIIDHESIIGDYAHLAPGSKLAGRVHIGENTFVGIGTCIIDKIEVGKNVIIGAGSTIIKNISSNKKVVGVSKLLD
ncbi:MAG: acetyltransferase [Crocinitomicaceae bacterium]